MEVIRSDESAEEERRSKAEAERRRKEREERERRLKAERERVAREKAETEAEQRRKADEERRRKGQAATRAAAAKAFPTPEIKDDSDVPIGGPHQDEKAIKDHREYREYTGQDRTGDPVLDQATIDRVAAADAAEYEVDRVPQSATAGLPGPRRPTFKEYTGQDRTGDPVLDQATIDRVAAADAAEYEVDRVPQSATAGLPGPRRPTFKEYTGQDRTGDPVLDQATIDRVAAADAAEYEDRQPLPGQWWPGPGPDRRSGPGRCIP